MNVINTNISALRATNASNEATKMLGQAAERLSTGKRINNASDDAAGLAIAASFTSQIRGIAQGVRNANDGISLAQTAEGSLDEVTNMLQRSRELTVQKNNGTYSTEDIANIETEQNALAEQINQIVENTEFNGINLFSTAANTVTIQSRCADGRHDRHRSAGTRRGGRRSGRRGDLRRDPGCRDHRDARSIRHGDRFGDHGPR